MRHIVVDSSYASIWRDLMEGISLYVRERRVPWQMHCAAAGDFVAAVKGKPDGVLGVMPRADEGLLELVRGLKIPTVNMFRNVHPLLPSVVSDNGLVGERAAEYFLGRGFRVFGFVGPEREWSEMRLEGYRRRLVEEGREVVRLKVPLTVQELKDVKGRRASRVLSAWAKSLPRPAAVLAASDFVAQAVLEGCMAVKKRVPDDVAILGVDNDLAVCEFAGVSLSSVPHNFARIGFEAARLLEGIMAGRRNPRKPVLIPPKELVVRRSTDIIAVDDPVVAQALQFIHHATERGGAEMKALLSEVGVSRQWLDRRFKAIMGRTASEEIRRLKLERARAMLLETRLSILEVAERCGFSHAENFCRFFREVTGKSPSAYREAREG